MGTDWSQARCLGKTDLFFDEAPEQVELAKAICSLCDIKAQCLQWALEYREPYGIWAGLDYLELRATAVLLGFKPPSRNEEIKHGTEKGYSWHIRSEIPIEFNDEGKDICGCQSAHREAARYRVAKYRKRLRSRRLSEGNQ
jgi:WhiB family redox-sensing transcriptional regulator